MSDSFTINLYSDTFELFAFESNEDHFEFSFYDPQQCDVDDYITIVILWNGDVLYKSSDDSPFYEVEDPITKTEVINFCQTLFIKKDFAAKIVDKLEECKPSTLKTHVYQLLAGEVEFSEIVITKNRTFIKFGNEEFDDYFTFIITPRKNTMLKVREKDKIIAFDISKTNPSYHSISRYLKDIFYSNLNNNINIKELCCAKIAT